MGCISIGDEKQDRKYKNKISINLIYLSQCLNYPYLSITKIFSFFFRNKGMSLSSSVSFRQGANVEFAGPAFVSTGDGKSGQDEVRLINFVILKN